MPWPTRRLGIGRIDSRAEARFRPANLIDGAIGLLALAVAFTAAREIHEEQRSWMLTVFLRTNHRFYNLVVIHYKVIAALVPLTLGYLAIRMRGRRPPSPRLARHPGFVAAAVATAAIMIGLALNLAKELLGVPIRRHSLPWAYDFYPSVGYVVMGSWLALAFTGRWHRDRLWLEVPGLLLGVGWIATALVEWAGLALQLDLYRF